MNCKLKNEDKFKILAIIISIVLFMSIFIMTPHSIHTATMEDLITIDHIGEVRAEAIIDYCKQNPRCTVEDLINIKGISDKLVENLKEEFR